MDFGGNSEFRELVGDLPVISVEVFDARWVIRRVDEIDVVDYIASNLTPDIAAVFHADR